MKWLDFHDIWTSPAGNVYYILASPFIAAELNMLNGASIPAAVQDAFNAAKSLFEAYTPAAAGALKGKDKKNWTDLAMILDDYNNGYTGPGHCSEEEEAEIEVTTYTKGSIVQQPVTPEEILLEAYPNPFGNELNFRIVLPYESRIVLKLFNMVGQKLAVLHDHVVEAGQVVDVNVQASELPAQTLIYRLSTSQEVLTGKILPMSR